MNIELLFTHESTRIIENERKKTKKPRGKTRKTARKKERNQEDEKYKFIII